MSANILRYPAVGGGPGSVVQKDPAQAPDPKESLSNKGSLPAAADFQKILGTEINKQVVEPLKFSAHATARLQSRQLSLGQNQLRELNEAVNKAAAKGLDETLILTKDAAFIVSVKNRTVVTAMDRNNMDGNVFTNIEGAVVM